ncbi:MAG: uroporphyrinogen-III synthase [Pseudomonadota bacterium]
MAAAGPIIVVTRAMPGAAETEARLREQGLKTASAPMLALKPLPAPNLPNAASLSGLVFTSANGVRTYADIRSDRNLTAWCVGPATARAASEAGFSDIRESAGNAADLVKFIAGQSPPSQAPLLHIANAAAAGNLKQGLEDRGYSVRFEALYEMRAATALPAAFAALIQSTEPVVILIHSAKGATALSHLCPDPFPTNWTIAAISDQAAAPLATKTQTPVVIADTPNEDGLMAALTSVVATLSA